MHGEMIACHKEKGKGMKERKKYVDGCRDDCIYHRKLRQLCIANQIVDDSKSDVIRTGHRLNNDSDSNDEIGF